MKSFSIAICDDEEYELLQIRNMLTDISGDYGYSPDISVYTKSSDILDAIDKVPQQFNMILLDIYIDERTGFDIAEALRRRNQHCAIVFITAFADKMAESFRYLTSAYLIKPVDRPKLEEAFQTALSHLNAAPRFHFSRKDEEYAILFSDIMYLESRLKNIYLFQLTKKDPTVFQGKLSEIKQSFPEEFFHLCHKSFMVNFSYVRMIDKVGHKVLLNDGRKLPVSRTYYRQILKDFTKFHSIRRD